MTVLLFSILTIFPAPIPVSAAPTISNITMTNTYIPDGWYRFESILSKKFGIHVEYNSKQVGTKVVAHTANNGDNEIWYLQRLPDSSYRIISKSTGYVLEIGGNDTVRRQQGAQGNIWYWENTPNQHFFIRNTPNGLMFINKLTGMTLDVFGGEGARNGDKICQWSYNEYDKAQLWKLIKVGSNNNTIIYGDINGDGQIDGNDLLLLRRHVNGERITDSSKLKAADVNCDGQINERDVELMRQYLAGIINKFPVETSGGGDQIPTVFFQTDSRWGNVAYPKPNGEWKTISTSGCAILATVNAVYALNGQFIDVATLAQFSLDNGQRANDGTMNTFPRYAADHRDIGVKYGFKCDGYSHVNKGSDWSRIKNHLQAAGVIVFVVGNADGNGGGHFMAITRYDSTNNTYLVLDSYPSSYRGTSNGYAWKTQSQIESWAYSSVECNFLSNR